MTIKVLLFTDVFILPLCLRSAFNNALDKGTLRDLPRFESRIKINIFLESMSLTFKRTTSLTLSQASNPRSKKIEVLHLLYPATNESVHL